MYIQYYDILGPRARACSAGVWGVRKRACVVRAGAGERTVTRICGGVAASSRPPGAEPGDRARTSDFVLKRSRAGRSSMARHIVAGTVYDYTLYIAT